MKLTAMVYARGNNQEGQIARCEQYAADAGYDVIGYVYENEMIDAIGNIDILLVSDLSRLSRDARECIGIINSLDDDGIRVEVANDDKAIARLTKAYLHQWI